MRRTSLPNNNEQKKPVDCRSSHRGASPEIEKDELGRPNVEALSQHLDALSNFTSPQTSQAGSKPVCGQWIIRHPLLAMESVGNLASRESALPHRIVLSCAEHKVPWCERGGDGPPLRSAPCRAKKESFQATKSKENKQRLERQGGGEVKSDAGDAAVAMKGKRGRK